MKVLFKIVFTLSLIISLSTIANANDRGVNGLIIGGGAGALMGQAVGRNVESTIIGATVGGIIGAVIGAEGSHRYRERVIVHEPPRNSRHGRQDNYSPRNHSPRIVYNRPPPRGHNFPRHTVIVHQQYRGKGKGNHNYSHLHKRRHNNPSHNRNRRQHNNYRW